MKDAEVSFLRKTAIDFVCGVPEPRYVLLPDIRDA